MSDRARMAKLVCASIAACAVAATCSVHTAETPDLPDPSTALDEACQLPEQAIDIPDGTTASEAELAQAQTAVRDYDAAITAYTLCLADAEARLVTLHPESAAQLGVSRAERNDAAVARAEHVVASFNDALKEYRNREFKGPVFKKMATEREREACYPRQILRTTVSVVLRISETGEVTDIEFPPGLKTDIETAVRCVVGKSEFGPATRNGEPVASNATQSFKFGQSESDLAADVELPVLMSRPEEIAAAHDKCLPTDLREGGNVGLILTVSQTGRVVSVQTAVSSGSEVVDRVAICLARKLRYTRPQFRGEAVEMGGVTVAVRVTPRSQNEPAATD